jgi:hypothetical protein
MLRGLTSTSKVRQSMWNAESCRLCIVFLSANAMVAKQSHPVKRCFLCATEFPTAWFGEP